MTQIKGVPIELGGATYVVPPLTLGALEQLMPRIQAFDGTMNGEQIATVLDCAHAALKRNYPDMSRETLAELVDLGNFGALFEAIMNASGLQRSTGEVQAMGLSSGNSSST